MSDAQPQAYENHRRIIVGYHGVTFGILAVNMVWSVWRMVKDLSIDAAMSLLLAVALLLLFYYARTFATTAQDRIIRLEERLRMEKLLPPDLATHVDEFTIGQLIALRFASDEELPELARRVRNEGVRDREAIKRSIRTWKPDYLRV